MPRFFIISDLHFYHTGIIPFDGRPYKCGDEMTEDLIKRWNEVVSMGDTVYVLGDMFYKASNDMVHGVLKRLNGNIIYVYGNHERPIKYNYGVAKKYFTETETYLEINKEINNKNERLVMSHYPIPMFNGHFYNTTTHFYGHVHTSEEQLYTVYQQLMNFHNSNEKNTHKMLNVGAMMSYMDYRPQQIKHLVELAEQRSDALYHYYNDICNRELPTLEEFRKETHLYL